MIFYIVNSHMNRYTDRHSTESRLHKQTIVGTRQLQIKPLKIFIKTVSAHVESVKLNTILKL
jgi:hypothetical protein